MTRIRCGVFVSIVLCGGCGHATTNPAAPTQLGGTPGGSPGTCAAPPYTISGVITVAGGGPLADVTVQILPYAIGYGTETKTNDQGQYSVCGPPGASKIGVEVSRTGYATAFKFDLTAQDHLVNFGLRGALYAPYGGGTVASTIRGDEVTAGDDYFGGRCEHTACKVGFFSSVGCPCPHAAEVTLRWSDPSSQLALYFPNAGVYWPPPIPVPAATRSSGPSPVVTTYVFNFDFDMFAVGFEEAEGHPASAMDEQSFELSVRPLP